MIRTILTAKKQLLELLLPAEWVGKPIEVIAFSIEEGNPGAGVLAPGHKIITVIEVPPNSGPFNRDELHER